MAKLAKTRRHRRGILSGTRLGGLVGRPSGLIGVTLTALIAAVALLADRIAPGDPLHIGSPTFIPPSHAHLFGTDYAGRDEFIAVIHGIRTTMTVVLWATLLSAALGIAIGAIAGYWGGRVVDRVLVRLIELFQTIPRFFFALLVLTLYGAKERNIILALGLTMWTFLARVVRAETLSVRQRDYVEAARAYGARDVRIIARHIIPNIMPTALVLMALNASAVILLEAGLAFIGLGDPYQLSLGTLINNAQSYLQQAWWMSVFPGLALLIAVLGINLLADGLNDVLNPRRRDLSTAGAWGRRIGSTMNARRQSVRQL